jgi:hypothetical protein
VQGLGCARVRVCKGSRVQRLRCARLRVRVYKGYSQGVQGLGCARVMVCKCKGGERLGFGTVWVWKG